MLCINHANDYLGLNIKNQQMANYYLCMYAYVYVYALQMLALSVKSICLGIAWPETTTGGPITRVETPSTTDKIT